MFGLLLWKEWRENLWKLSFCGVASVAFSAMLFRMRIIPDMSNCMMISMVQMFAVPVIYALDIFSGEMSNRTVHLLFKLPVRRRLIFFSKYLVSIFGMVMVFVITSVVMEVMAGGRESEAFSLLRANLQFCLVSLILFTWFCAFGSQCRSEASSLAVIFGVIIGWGIVFLWALMGEVEWAIPFVPYSIVPVRMSVEVGGVITAVFQVPVLFVVVCVGCYRYVKLRRYL